MNIKENKKELEIPKEAATFWMDGKGCWHNRHGPFENKKIIDYFNAAIQCDAKGYHVAQLRDGIEEKVYFSFEDTALFVVDVIQDGCTTLVLNTGKQIPLNSDKLYICNDQLYIFKAKERIKFGERALLKLAEKIVYEQGGYYYNEDGKRHTIPSVPVEVAATEDKPE